MGYKTGRIDILLLKNITTPFFSLHNSSSVVEIFMVNGFKNNQIFSSLRQIDIMLKKLFIILNSHINERFGMYDRISVDPKVCHGQACIKGTRIPVHQIVRMLANGDEIDDLLKEYSSLKREDILACLDYAAALAEEQITPIEELASRS
jgi:uncharacterized protein (DUF433 family)